MLSRFVRELGLQLISGVVFNRKKDNQNLSQLLIAIAVGIKMRFIDYARWAKLDAQQSGEIETLQENMGYWPMIWLIFPLAVSIPTISLWPKYPSTK